MKILYTAVALMVCSFGVHSSNIKFLQHNFDPLVSVPGGEQTPLSNDFGEGLFFIQFNDKVKQTWLDQLTRQDITLLQYYPDNTYLVWGATQRINTLESLNFVRWSGGFSKKFKISPNLNNKNISGEINNVDVHFYNAGSPDAVLAQLTQAGGNILNHYPAQPDKKLYDAIITIDESNLSKIADIPEVVWAGFIGPRPILDDESSSQTIAGNFDGSGQPLLGYDTWLQDIGLDGTGVIWSITDSGVDYSHGDLNTRIVGGHNYTGCVFPDPGDDPATGGHGTHVAGIVGADASAGFTDGDGYLYGLGVAPNFSIFAQNPICNNSVNWPPTGGWQELSKQGVLGGAVGANNSWTSGEGANHGYQATERTIDFATRDGDFDTAGPEEYMWVFSAGNSGPGSNTLTSPKEAKNVIVTAASQTWRVSGNVEAIAGFSSRGPAVDGRYVPTITAPGQSVGSTMNDGASQCASPIGGTNNQYSLCSGTSMAAPHTSGALVLITQWWRDNNSGDNPSTAMGKALLVNTATDVSGAAAIPNFEEGWGLINLKNLFQPETPFVLKDQEDVLDNTGEVWETSVGVLDPSKPLKITIAWSDAPGAIGANPALVNNLDLEVDNGGNTYLGNDFSGGVSTTGGSADVLNNTENVFITNPGGSATIRVRATNIAGDGIPFSGDVTDQDFAFVCSNCAEEPSFTIEPTPSSMSVCAGGSYSIDFAVSGLLGYTETVTLTEHDIPGFVTNAVLSPDMVVPDATSNYSFDVDNSGTNGPTTMTIRGTGPAIGDPVDPDVIFGNDFEEIVPLGDIVKDVVLDFFYADGAPVGSNLTAPADAALSVALLPTYTWDAQANVESYLIEVATDAGFTNIVESATVSTNSYTQTSALTTETQYFWRVTASNSCDSTVSSVFSFTTQVAPGTCAAGTVVTDQIVYDFDADDEGFTVSTAAGQTNWALTAAVGNGGSQAFQADDLPEVNDTSLLTPVISLPTGVGPLTLRFWNEQTIEDRGGGCYDSATLEVSVDGGEFNQVTNADIIANDYDGPTDGGFSHPLPAGTQAWCGDPMAPTEFSVDINAYAGQDVQFAFRMTSDDSVGRPDGWVIDDVRVTGCEAP